MDAPWTAPAILLATAFFPLALIVTLQLLPRFRPPKHRPSAFILGGLFLLALGSLSAYTLRSAVVSGVFHHSSRRFGEFHAEVAHQPIEFWLYVLVLYSAGVFLAGLGLAGFGLCLRKASRQ